MRTEKQVATDFISLVANMAARIEYEETKAISVLGELVSRAGFQRGSVIKGKLRGDLIGHNSRDILGQYDINKQCPYKVKAPGNQEDHYKATGWLDIVFSHTLYQLREKTASVKIRDWIIKEIRRSVPLEPIMLGDKKCLTQDILIECYPSTDSSYLVNHTRDSDLLEGSTVGVHDICGEYIDRKHSSRKFDVLYCKSCGLRVKIPVRIKTFGDLRRFSYLNFQT